MRRLVLVLAWFVCTAAHAQYTLVLGVGDAGNGRGYREYAAENCPTAEPCLTYCDLHREFNCDDCERSPHHFYECIMAMMQCAHSIVFIVDKPDGWFGPDDECGPGDPCARSYTRLELW